jgi:hypothetical protein
VSTQFQINLGANSSNVTGTPYFVGDFTYLTVSKESGSAFASRLTILASNQDGFQSQLGTANATVPAGNWSILTVITNQGIYPLDSGFRWINAVRPTQTSGQTASNITVTFAGTL